MYHWHGLLGAIARVFNNRASSNGINTHVIALMRPKYRLKPQQELPSTSSSSVQHLRLVRGGRRRASVLSVYWDLLSNSNRLSAVSDC